MSPAVFIPFVSRQRVPGTIDPKSSFSPWSATPLAPARPVPFAMRYVKDA